jgi:hypothetical protein
MSTPTPPHLAGARAQLQAAVDSAEGKKIDLDSASWVDLEKYVIKLLGGPFRPNETGHQVIALGLAAVLGEKLARDTGAFWFPSRESPEGAAMGFPEALVMLSPFSAILEGLSMSRLERVEEIAREIRASLAQAKFSGAGAQRLQPGDYQALFDPGYVQLVAIDAERLQKALETPPDRLSIDVRDAIGRARGLPDQAKKQVETQLVNSLARLERGKPVIEQVPRAPRLAELIANLFGATNNTGSAPEELWSDVVMPLLFVGAPEKFPELDDEEVHLAKQGVDPFVLFLEVVPFTWPAPEEGLLGAFPADGLDLPHRALEPVGQPRIIKVTLDAVKTPLEKFDAGKTKDAIARFTKHLEAKLGEAPKSQPQAAEMLDAALAILDDFKKISQSGQMICVRRLTEAEAASDMALMQVRSALHGPRIILA